MKTILRVGAAKTDITPPNGTQLGGATEIYRPAETVRDPTYARVLVIEQEGTLVCLVTLDLLAHTRRTSAPLRRLIAEELGTTPDAVLIFTTQSHAAPAFGPVWMRDENPLITPEFDWLRGGDRAYIPLLNTAVLEAVRRSKATMRPATMRVGRCMDGRIAFNRRFIFRDGTAHIHPSPDDARVLHCEGPSDPEVGVAVFEDEQGHAISALLNHTCHPGHGYGQRWVSAGWPGAWCSALEASLGQGCVPLVLNGACGNIHHRDHMTRNHDDSIERMTRDLMETTRLILASRLSEPTTSPMRHASRTITVPYRKADPNTLRAAKAIIAKHPRPEWGDKDHTIVSLDWVNAAFVLERALVAEEEKTFQYETQLIRIGDLVIVGWPGEPFVEAQLEIKKQAPADYVFVGHFCNDNAGYQPTAHAFRNGGYEVDCATLEPGTLENVQTQTKAYVRDIMT